MKEIILMKYGELALKGANKNSFESVLIKNIRKQLAGKGRFSISKAQSTITVTPLDADIDMDECFETLSKVFGIAAISRSAVVEKSFEAICEGASYLDDVLANALTFKVEAKRSDKSFPMKSPEICGELGYYLLNRHSHLRVDVHNPQVVVWVEVRDHNAFIHSNQSAGAGGIPVGSGGNAALLLSGGIDSPVAGIMAAKRGLELIAIHFESPPYTSERALLKVKKLCQRMAAYTGTIKLFVVPFTEIQDNIGRNCPEEYFTVIMRRFMMDMASRLAKKNKCHALITGESLGQVASQTVQAIACTDIAASLPVLRPVIGMDKEEIVTIARKIDTFEVSILPYEDCCTVFTPRHPRTKPKLELVIDAEKNLSSEELIEKSLDNVKIFAIDTNTEI